MKIYAKLQTPTIELPVTIVDGSGTKDTIVVGFKRYEAEDSKEKIKTLQTVLDAYAEQDDGLGIADFVKSEIVYLKKLDLILQDDNNVNISVRIEDTRKFKESKQFESLWGSEEERLSVLVDLFLASTPYKNSLILSCQKAILNMELEEARAKN